MEMVYIVNGNESGGGGGSGGGEGASAGYRLVKAVVTDGSVGLQDRCVTRVELNTSNPVRINFPPKTEGIARDFLLRLVITSDAVPEVTFAVPTGETFSFEEGSEETFCCVLGVNVFAFTETDDGLFVVSRKHVSIVQVVTFDANGGTVEQPSADYLLGERYGTLPAPSRRGFAFVRWTTEDGVEVTETDTVKSSVTRLVAEWETYVDKYAPAIYDGQDLMFVSDGDSKWTLDSDEDRGDVARSGGIVNDQRSSLYTTVEGAGTLSFAWKVSSESNYDKGIVFVDGAQKLVVSGEKPWTQASIPVTGEGSHLVEWRYMKDGSVSQGSDCLWLDEVRWEVD